MLVAIVAAIAFAAVHSAQVVPDSQPPRQARTASIPDSDSPVVPPEQIISGGLLQQHKQVF